MLFSYLVSPLKNILQHLLQQDLHQLTWFLCNLWLSLSLGWRSARQSLGYLMDVNDKPIDWILPLSAFYLQFTSIKYQTQKLEIEPVGTIVFMFTCLISSYKSTCAFKHDMIKHYKLVNWRVGCPNWLWKLFWNFSCCVSSFSI